jgi:hypothetical protein
MSTYSIVSGWDPNGRKLSEAIAGATNEQLDAWANDPNCKERGNAADELSDRQKRGEAQDIFRRNREEAEKKAQLANATRRAELLEHPFDARTEVSAGARHIVKHLWIIFVLLPVVLGILFALLR